MFKKTFPIWLLVLSAFALSFLSGVWGKYADDGLGMIFSAFWFIIIYIVLCVVARNRKEQLDSYADAHPYRYAFFGFLFIVIVLLCHCGGTALVAWYMGYPWMFGLMLR